MIIAIDFDGTIVEHKFPNIGRALPHAFDTMKHWKQQGHQLILWTCRSSFTLADAISFCQAHGLSFDAVNDNIPGTGYSACYPKIYADVYIDDRSLFASHPLDWIEIERLAAAWKTRS